MNVRRSSGISGLTSRSRLLPGTALAGATALGMVALTGCGGGTASGGEDGKLDVVASFYPMEFLAEEIGGKHVSVSALTEPGVEPHDLELKPRQIGELSEAGLVVYLKGFQPAVDEAVEQSGAEHVAEATSYTEPVAYGGGHEGEEHADEHGGHEGEKPTDEGGHEGHGHEDGAIDPHLWLDPVKYAEVAEGVGEAMAKADPDNAADYRENAKALVSKLNALDEDFREGLENRRTDTFITTHAAFGYLSARYGLREEAIAGLDPEAGPSGARMKELTEVAREDDVNTVFFETLASDSTARTFARDLDLKTDVLDPIEGINDASRGDDYLEIMRSNLEALRKALGAR